MSDWIHLRATEIRLAEKERKAERDRQSEAAATLKAIVEPFWNDLLCLLEDSVEQFNAEFPEPERQIKRFERSSTTGLVIERGTYPTVFVKAQLNNGSSSVSYSISRTPRKGIDTVEKQGNFAFGLKDGTVGYVDVVRNHEDVAKLFLEPFFQF